MLRASLTDVGPTQHEIAVDGRRASCPVSKTLRPNDLANKAGRQLINTVNLNYNLV